MSVIAVVLVFVSAVPGDASLSGHVVDPKAAEIAGARVFMEPGLAGEIVETVASSDGAWGFDAVAADSVGVFAIADGFAFGGATVNVAAGDQVSDVTLRLGPAAALTGKVVDGRKHPVKGARITRVALLGGTKVSIPFAKLKSFGFDEPVSGDDGRFTVPRLPEGGNVALKVGHPDYAQEALDNVSVGADVTVTLSVGVFFEGDVILRGGSAPVVDAAVIVRNAQPPYDTAVTKTNAAGAFAMRLKPGVYLYQAAAAAFRSPGWERLTITGGEPRARTKIYVAGVGQIRGKVCDAVSGEPVSGARLVLDTQGNAAGVVRTGHAGEFALPAMAGENLVRLDAAPGYLAPEPPAVRIQVAEGKEVALPTFWLAPIPPYTLQIVDENAAPAPGVVVAILRPEQFGWRVTDAQGCVTLKFASLPSGGTIMGTAEHVTKPLGALFAFKRDEKQPRAQLLPLAAVKGQLVSTRQRPVSGAVVTGMLGDDGLVLWRTVTNKDGVFEWTSIAAQATQHAAVQAGPNKSVNVAPFAVDGSATKDLGRITAPESASAVSLQGKPFPWDDLRLVGGALPDRAARRGIPAVLMFCEAADAAMAIDGLAVAGQVFAGRNIILAVVVNGTYTPREPPIPVLSGKPPGAARTYLVGPDGNVFLETFGMPPLRALQQFTSAGP